MNKQQHDGVGFYLVGSGNGVHHVAVQNNVIVNSKAPAGITVRGRSHNILIKGNTITGHSRWVLPDKTDPQYVGPPTHPNHRRFDAHAIAIEGTNLTRSVETVRIEANILKNNGGDGVQCLGVNDDAGAFSGDPIDIDIVDNRVQNDPGSSPVEENGFDIKSCNQVSIRGRTPNAGEALGQNSKISEFLPTTRALDWGGGNFANGDAIVVHYHARNVHIQNTRMWNVCNGIVVGRNDATVQHKVQNVVIRRNLIFSQRYKQTSANGAPQDADRCRGRGIQITNADNVDLYHNTLDGVPTTALQVGDSGGPAVPNDVDIWNNIFVLSKSVGAEPRYWINIVAEGANVDSDYNLLWHQNGPAAADNHFAIENTRLTLAQWRATDRDIVRSTLPRSAWDDPRFVADPTSNDYFTQPGSPARDAALHNTGSTYCQTRPDIGFLESCT